MDHNFDRVLNQEWRTHDLKCLTSQIREHESLLRLKRRWLMDLSLSEHEQKRLESALLPNDKMLPESLLREDDVNYENIRTCIEKGFGVHSHGNEVHYAQKDHVFKSQDSIRSVFFLLDDMSNKGLCSLIEILTGGMVNFEKTNSCMKRTIRGLLRKVFAVKSDIPEKKLKQIFQLFKDKKSFRGNQMLCSTASEAYHAAAIKVLDGLDDFPLRTLFAMHRKLKGVKGYIPSMQPPRNGMGRDNLTKLVKKYSSKMLSDLGEVDEPSERLAAALGVAGLTLKLMNFPSVGEFRKFSPEIEALQNDIAKAIHLLNDTKKVSLIELRKVQQLLDPSFQLSVRSIRIAIRNFLTEYLFECSDMDEVPGCVVQTLDIINRRSQNPSRKKCSNPKVCSSPGEVMKEVILNEVECVLAISAEAKEVILNLIPRHDFDEDFAHAYVEDYEEGDTLCISDDDEQVGDIFPRDEFHSYSNYDRTESIGETNPGELNSSISTSEKDDCSFFPERMLNPPPDDSHSNEFDSCKKSKAPDGKCTDGKKYSLGCVGLEGQAYNASHDMKTEHNLPTRSRTPDSNSKQNEVKCEETTSQQSRLGNQYLEVQEACDVTSMIAYRFAGHALNKLSQFEGLELYQGDRLYLQSHSSIPEDSEGSPDALLTSEFSEIWRSVLQQ